MGFTDLFDFHPGSDIGWQRETATTTTKQKTVPLLLSQRGRTFIFAAEGLVRVLCIHLFQHTSVAEPLQSQSTYPYQKV